MQAVLHKASDELEWVSVETPEGEGLQAPCFSERVQRLRAWLARHPEVPVVDRFEATEKVGRLGWLRRRRKMSWWGGEAEKRCISYGRLREDREGASGRGAVQAASLDKATDLGRWSKVMVVQGKDAGEWV